MGRCGNLPMAVVSLWYVSHIPDVSIVLLHYVRYNEVRRLKKCIEIVSLWHIAIDPFVIYPCQHATSSPVTVIVTANDTCKILPVPSTIS